MIFDKERRLNVGVEISSVIITVECGLSVFRNMPDGFGYVGFLRAYTPERILLGIIRTMRFTVSWLVTYTALFNLALPQKQSLFRTIEWKRYDVSLWSSVKPIYNKKLYSTQDNDWTESPRFRWLSLTMQSGLCTGKYARWIWQYSNRIDIFRSRRRPRKILNSTVWSGFPRNMQDGFSYGRTE
ncbi:hypothetical protein V1478_004762 [Vespula squamosa]|uniref:Uncharacterized protein n=1 Tax=Vespula squamosa TaxID=30214 RepID=A0ABD2BHH3_VESSQ